jgi:hypothetical protein
MAQDFKAAKQIRCCVIVKLGATIPESYFRPAGKIIWHRGDSGNVTGELWDWTGEEPAHFRSRAGGYGYDKHSACIEGMTFAGKKLSHNWQSELYQMGYDVFYVM